MSLSTAPAPIISLSSNGSQEVGSQFIGYCFVYLPSPELANLTVINWLDGLGNFIPDQFRFKRQEEPQYRVQQLPVTQFNETHVVRQIVLDPLQAVDEGYYFCQAYFSGEFVASNITQQIIFLDVFGKLVLLICSTF